MQLSRPPSLWWGVYSIVLRWYRGGVCILMWDTSSFQCAAKPARMWSGGTATGTGQQQWQWTHFVAPKASGLAPRGKHWR